jgi:hypothetical protein
VIDNMDYTYPLRMTKKDKLPEAALEFFRKQGHIGGTTRAERMSPEERSEQARKAVQARWAKTKKTSKKK